MTGLCKLGLRVALFLSVVGSGTITHEQVTQAAPNNDALAVSLEMQTEHIPVGQMPRANLTMKNVSNDPVTVRKYRVHVDGKNGEPPTTLVQRDMTDTLRPGEAPLPITLNVGPPIVQPDGSYVLKFDLAYLYDLSAPGVYTVYAEVLDPSSHRWLRTQTAKFEMISTPQ